MSPPQNSGSRIPGQLTAADLLVAANIRTVRKARGLTQGDIGAALGLNRALVCKIEKGNRTVTVGELVIIAKTLGVDPALLLQPIRVRPMVVEQVIESTGGNPA